MVSALTREQQLYVNCLARLQSFETFFGYSSQSSWVLYADEAKASAREFLKALDELAGFTPQIIDGSKLNLGAGVSVHEWLSPLRTWAESDSERPSETPFWNRWRLLAIGVELKNLIWKELGLTGSLPNSFSSDEAVYSSRGVRWRPHLPERLLLTDPDALIARASETETIAVIADIRRSQDLMTYSSDAGEFSRHIVEFINGARRLSDQHGGLFDKFTGDGFLVYFNDAICSHMKKGYADSFLAFVRDEVAESRELFGRWSRSVRKIPAEGVGLAMGADVGRVQFLDQGGQLVAVGDALVWAARMAEAAGPGEVLVNNLLATHLQDNGVDSQVGFETRQGHTKSGESFLGTRLLI